MKRKRFLLRETGNNKMRKVFLFLAAVAVCFCMAGEVMGQTSGNTGSCKWELTGTSGNYTLTISGNGAMGNYYSYSSTPWYSYRSDIKTVEIQQGVTSIGNYAFYGCSSLTSITIPDLVTSIGYYAFDGCSSLTSITIPDLVKSIGVYTFHGCSNLTSVTIPNSVTSIEAYAFYGCSSLTSVTIPNLVKSIGLSAFYYCSSLASVTIPNSVESIGNSAFRECRELTSVTISDLVKVIEDYTFYNCGSLISITIPDLVTSIGNSAFRECVSLTSVTIPDLVESIEELAFYNCRRLTSVTIPDRTRSVGDYAFEGCGSLTSITIGNSVGSIGSGAFSHCGSLTSVTIPNSVTSIGNNAFYGCLGLTAINVGANNPGYSAVDGILFNKLQDTLIQYPAAKTGNDYAIPNSVTSIEYYAFSGCSNLTSVTIPRSVTSIGGGAFVLCNNLATVNFNAVNCTEMASGAFEGCELITALNIGNEVTTIPAYAFSSLPGLTSVAIPHSVESIGNGAFSYCTGLTAINVDANNLYYSSIDGVLFNKSQSVLILYPASKTGNDYTIPNLVTSIRESAFYYCAALTSITIPNSVTSIGDGAFRGCDKLATITGGNGLNSIGSRAFHDTQWYSAKDNNSEVYVGTVFYRYKWKYEDSDLDNPPSISIEIAEGTLGIADEALRSDDWSESNPLIQSVTLPNSLTHIGERAFSSCRNLSSITLPPNIQFIGTYAFMYCNSLLTVHSEAATAPTLGSTYVFRDNYFTPPAGQTLYLKPNATGYESNKGWPATQVRDALAEENGLIYSVLDANAKTVKVRAGDTFNASDLSALRQTILYEDETYTLTVIEAGAFKGNQTLTSVTIPNSVTSIGSETFVDCAKLTSLVIPNTVTTIANYTFDGCIKLETLTLPLKSIANNYLGQLFHEYFDSEATSSDYQKPSHPIEGYNQNAHIAERCSYCFGSNFSGYRHRYYYVPSSLKTVNIIDAAEIKDNFFQNTNLETVEMPLVKSIGNNAFSGCTSLVHVEIPNSVTGIGNSAFSDCKLVSVEMPDGIVSVGSSAFSGCPLKNVLTPILESSLFPASLEKLTITSACTSIPASTLSRCSNLQELTLPFIGTSPTATEAQALLGVLFGYSSTGIRQYYSNEDYDTYAIPQTLEKITVTRPATQIKYGAFYNCSFLKEVVIGSEVTGVGQKAFFNCNGLTDIYTHRAMPPSAYANSTFDGVSKFSCRLHVPANSKQYYSHTAAAGWNEFFTIEEEAPLTVTALPLPYYGGQVTGITAYNYEDNATIEAHSNTGYNFQAWMEGTSVVSIDNPYIFTVTAPRTLYAVFAPRENENSVTVAPQPTEVSIEWDSEAGASSYTLVIYLDAARTQVYTTLRFDADGTPQAVPLLRSVQSRMSCTVDGLQAGEEYYYSITSYDAEEYALSVVVGSFETPIALGIESVESRGIRIYPNPVTESFRIAGLTAPTQVTVTNTAGQTVGQQIVSGDESISIRHLPQGVYLVRANGQTAKMIKN
jgi:hypothetical protein